MTSSSIHSLNTSMPSEVMSHSSNITFQPVKRRDIEAKNFVDLTCMDNSHGLKMMVSIKNGQLVLLAGKNKGLLRQARHYLSSKSNYFQLQLITPKNVNEFKELWLGDDGKLHTLFTTPNDGAEQYRGTVNIVGQFAGDMKSDSSQRSYDVIVVKDLESCKTQVVPTIALKDGSLVKVFKSDSGQGYSVCDNIGNCAVLNLKGLKLSQSESVEHIKPCGSYLQVTIKSDDNNQKIKYLDASHLSLSSDTQNLSPVVTDEPPAGFAHFNVNNSGHFANANPFVSKKFKHIGNQYIPLSGWIDGIKHRFTSGQLKSKQGRKKDARLSYLKMADPGIHTAGRWVKERVNHRKPSQALISLTSDINSELMSLRRFQFEWNWEVGAENTATSSKNTDFRLREVLKREIFPEDTKTVDLACLDKILEDRLKKQLDLCVTTLTKLSPSFQSEHGSYDQKLKPRITAIQKKIVYLTSHPNFTEMPHRDEVVQIQALLNTLVEANSTPFKEKDLDLYLPFIERTLTNTRLYLATFKSESGKSKTPYLSDLIEKPKMILVNKLGIENQSQLFKAVSQSIASLKSAKEVIKTRVRIGESILDTKRGIGKIWSRWLGRDCPAEQITTQLYMRTSALQKGDSLTLSAEQGISGFAGIAHFGLPYPLGKGWFAGVVANYEKHYDCKLVALGEGKTQVQFVRKREKGATVMAGTGTGLEDLTKLVKYQHGALVTIMPFEATLAMTAMKESEQSFAFDVDNGHLKDTLDCMFGIRDWKPGLEEQLEKSQLTAREKQKFELGVSANSEFRLQLGIDTSPNFSMVAPRAYAKAGISIAVSRKDIREIKLGEENSAFQRRDYEKGVDVEFSSGANVMLFPLPAPYALPAAIDEKTFISVKPLGDALKSIRTTKNQTTKSVQDLVPKMTCAKVSSQEQTAMDEVIEGFKKLIEETSLHPEVRSIALTQLELLLNAGEKGAHEVVKSIAAEEIPNLKIRYDEKIQWRSRWADNMRRVFHMKPKYSTSFKQMMEPYAGGAKLLRELRASAQSQSQMLNVNKSSLVTATANYQMPMSILLWQYQQTLERLESADNSKKALKTLQSLNQLLNRKGDTARGLYQLDKIECCRESSLSHQPAGILPMVQVKQKSQVKMKELLGDIKFIYDGTIIVVNNNLDVSIINASE
ncbi:hypothetical protein F0225_17130 [Vibrio pectenicida]|uniref:Uncharacterized protein n=1 Tax=Vibrio pectenicida TaxID=62763 RepID=A0A7Y4A1K1_9VIBR|nr:hypothetical protein [Vibrio pectenicida]NOH73045.1 hypothetical protein [Vibrio pectenicida]